MADGRLKPKGLPLRLGKPTGAPPRKRTKAKPGPAGRQTMPPKLGGSVKRSANG